jgi:hypothetical protein
MRLAVLAGWVGMFGVVAWLAASPEPLAMDAPPEVFSAHRAYAQLARILGDERPHPTGSAENAAVRSRLLDELADLGLDAEVQRVGPVHNVVARLEGREPGAVLLMGHYDSVPTGPGASDNGVGVVTLLETARALQREVPLRHPVVLLFDDGEEQGLWGAQAFREEHRWASEVQAVLDFEARGVTGPSLMFQTIGPSGWMVAEFAAVAPQPVSSSGFAAVYERMPNDTNLSVFRDDGIAGLDFAFIGGLRHYHQPTDDLAHVDLGTLQHHGSSALALTRAIADSDLGAGRTDRRVFFDVLSLFVVGWPQPWSVPLAALALLAAVLLWREWRGAGSVLGTTVVGAVAGGGAVWALGVPFAPASPWPGILAAQAVGVATLALWPAQRERSGGVWLVWSVAGVACAVTLPGLSYLFIVPALAAVGGRAPVVGALVASALWFRLHLLVPDALGASLGPLHGATVGWLVSAWVPVLTAGDVSDMEDGG